MITPCISLGFYASETSIYDRNGTISLFILDTFIFKAFFINESENEPYNRVNVRSLKNPSYGTIVKDNLVTPCILSDMLGHRNIQVIAP